MGLRRVTLSIGRYSYTCELVRESDTSWRLQKVQVHNVAVVGHIDFHAGSCLAALQQGELVANEIIASAGAKPSDPKMNR
ncbi:hypothetical protein EGJ34_17165 [Stenotrophomonas sp. 278]|nr:hypothetical protein EGJ34_17165 [Stenotrophomonas sp. 278]